MCLLYTDGEDLSRFTFPDSIDDLRHEWPEVTDAIAWRSHEHNGDVVRGQVLLEPEILVHRHERLELASRSLEQRTVFETSPSESNDRLYVERGQFLGEVYRD